MTTTAFVQGMGVGCLLMVYVLMACHAYGVFRELARLNPRDRISSWRRVLLAVFWPVAILWGIGR